MSFEETLGKVLRGLEGAIGAVLMGRDGVPIAQLRIGGDQPLGILAGDVAAAAVEFGRALDEVRKAGEALGGGDFEECTVGFGSYSLLFRVVDHELLLCVALTAGGNLGKARYRLRRYLLELQEQL